MVGGGIGPVVGPLGLDKKLVMDPYLDHGLDQVPLRGRHMAAYGPTRGRHFFCF